MERQFLQPNRQLIPGEPPQVPLNFGTKIHSHVFHSYPFAAESGDSVLPVCAELEPNSFAAEKDFISHVPLPDGSGLNCLAQQLPFQPADVRLGEPTRLGYRPASWDRHARAAIGAEPQHVPPSARIGYQPQANETRADL